MKRIYINTRQAEENRVIITEDGKLAGFEQDFAGSENKKGDIYKGVVTRVEESLDAVFVDFGEDKEGFLPFKHIAPNLPGSSGGKNKVAKGDSILVQIKKDHVGGKGAGLTTYITLAGSYLVLRPNRESRMLVSKQIDPQERKKMLEIFKALELPEGMSAILRSAGEKCSVEELRWDLESYLLKLWDAINQAAAANKNPILIYRENNLLLRAVRDYFNPDEDEIYCDSLDDYNELKRFLSLLSADKEHNLHYHNDSTMIPEEVEKQIDEVHERKVRTPAGAMVVFDSTEALVAIDVNSAQMRVTGDIEETALRSNMEAADVIALHLRLRDLAGLIVVDFIDMVSEKNRTKLSNYFVTQLRKDRARIQWTPLSRFGMMEISRQRLSRSVEATQNLPCKSCQGTGRQWRPEAFALRLLRQIRAITQKTDVSAVVVRAPADTAIYLLNEKRVDLRRLENESNCEIIVAPDEYMYAPDFSIRPIRDNRCLTDSYKFDADIGSDYAEAAHERLQARRHLSPTKSLINTVMPETRAPNTGNGNFFANLYKKLFGTSDKQKKIADNGNSRQRRNANQRRISDTQKKQRASRGIRQNSKNTDGQSVRKEATPSGTGEQKMIGADNLPEKKRSRRSPRRKTISTTVATNTVSKAKAIVEKEASTAKKIATTTVTPTTVEKENQHVYKQATASSNIAVKEKQNTDVPEVDKVWFEPEHADRPEWLQPDVDTNENIATENQEVKLAVRQPEIPTTAAKIAVKPEGKSAMTQAPEAVLPIPEGNANTSLPNALLLQMIESKDAIGNDKVKMIHDIKDLSDSKLLSSSVSIGKNIVMKQIETATNE